MEILLNSLKNINSVNVDNYDKVELSNKLSLIHEYDIRNVLSATEVFDAEREANEIYRIYGKIEYLSMLNGLKSSYSGFTDFFNPQITGSYKSLLNSFDFYLVKPASSGYTQITGLTGGSSPASDTIILDEKFDTWVTSSPSNYPLGWGVTATAGSYAQQTPSNQALFYLHNDPFMNLVTLNKTLTPIFGNIKIETNVNILPNLVIGTDLLTITLFDSTNAIIASFNTLATSTGFKEFEVDIPLSTPVTKISIFAKSTNKTLYMDYLKVYIPAQEPVVSNNLNYIRKFEVIATPNEFELYPAGFANNVYGEQAYAFNFNEDFDVSGLLDGFGFPLTELFLYVQYKPTLNGDGKPEKLFATTWSPVTDVESTFELTPTVPTFNIGDILFHNMNYIGDVIGYSKSQFYQAQEHPQTFYIETPYKGYIETTVTVLGTTVTITIPADKRLRWKYNPFIPFQLRYFSDELYKENTGNTAYDIVASIPYFATKLDDMGNYVWRKILPQGYIDPLTGIGVDYPFVNQRRYLFSNILFIITPDLNDNETRLAFEEAWYTRNPKIIAVKPTSNLSNIGKPCL